MNMSTAMDSREETIRQEVALGASILRQEAESLVALADSLDASFHDAVDCLYSIKGRVVATGMGKSGHVARKVAATMASVGTPAFFLHPAEASHGDLGMLTGDDAVLAFSNSGETKELYDLITFVKRQGIPLVGVTSGADSVLGRQSDYLLLLPFGKEADPLDCAPTTSSTLQMAIGDALALVLMRRHNCTRELFHQFHPRGTLGQRLQTVGDIMHTGDEMPLLPSETLMSDVLIEMTGKGFGVAGILDWDGRLIGIITDGDLRRNMCREFLTMKAGEVMHANPLVIAETTLVAAALHDMQANKVTTLFVTRDYFPVGILNVHDCLRAGA